jgi:hypothetical protein
MASRDTPSSSSEPVGKGFSKHDGEEASKKLLGELLKKAAENSEQKSAQKSSKQPAKKECPASTTYPFGDRVAIVERPFRTAMRVRLHSCALLVLLWEGKQSQQSLTKEAAPQTPRPCPTAQPLVPQCRCRPRNLQRFSQRLYPNVLIPKRIGL